MLRNASGHLAGRNIAIPQRAAASAASAGGKVVYDKFARANAANPLLVVSIESAAIGAAMMIEAANQTHRIMVLHSLTQL